MFDTLTAEPLAPLTEHLKRANIAAQHFDKWPESPVRDRLIEVCYGLCITFGEHGFTCDPGEIIQKPLGSQGVEDPLNRKASYAFKFIAWKPGAGDLPDITRYMCGAFLMLTESPSGDLAASEEGRIITDCPFITDSDLYGLPINRL